MLLAGVFLGLLTGALVSLVLLATRRAALRTAVPFGPPLIVGAVLALALAGSGMPMCRPPFGPARACEGRGKGGPVQRLARACEGEGNGPLRIRACCAG